MWANVNAQSVHQQNAVSLMQVDMLQLGVLQTQMDNLSVQATLLIGFALSMWGGATLKPLLEDDSQICIWKTWYHLAFAAVFFVTIALCISCGGIIVSLVLYIKQAAQESALLVSTGAAVANTRRHLSSLNRLFVVSYASFALSAVLAHRMGRGTSGKKHLHRARATAHGSTARDSESGRSGMNSGNELEPQLPSPQPPCPMIPLGFLAPRPS